MFVIVMMITVIIENPIQAIYDAKIKPNINLKKAILLVIDGEILGQVTKQNV